MSVADWELVKAVLSDVRTEDIACDPKSRTRSSSIHRSIPVFCIHDFLDLLMGELAVDRRQMESNELPVADIGLEVDAIFIDL